MDESQIRRLLQRAEEIQQQSDLNVDHGPEVEQIALAAEEAGLSRDAVRRALQERLSLERPAQVDDLVFAKSPDGRHYVAKVVGVEPGAFRLRFLTGSDATLPTADVKPFSAVPGMKLEVPWPNWGWWNSTVVSYDRDNGKVTVTDGMHQETFHISDVRLRADLPPVLQRTYSLTVVVVTAVCSGALGVLIARLLMR